MSRVVLVTGVASPFAARFARRLAGLGETSGIDKVVGIDTILPAGDLGRVKYVRADIRTSVVGKVIAVEEADTVVHLDVNPPKRGRASGAKELNVIGTMQLLAACQRSSNIAKLVLGSSAAVYGTSPRDPAMFTESLPARGGVRSGFPKDMVEVESYVRGFSRRRPEVITTTLRSAQVLHPDIDSPLGSYFANPVLPTVMGYDPRLQFLDLEDALNVLTEAVLKDRPGTFNVAGDGVVLLSQAARRLGRPVIPLPPIGFASASRRVIRAMGSDISPDLHRLLTYGRVVDTSALRDIFGFEPARSSAETFDLFRSSVRPGILSAVGGR
ncbi:NAD-dependent epimerase/dehydratase family protein [Aeromicrobium sp.]|uniref:NAD-dependent epimerase/dehydratase family protein n=1 Tax=Aeromicrobium sp. TaxID=1871063 RepID=UPI0019C46BC3|nr:NAD-dependent epimerase/dehydratase family protein [Aeromicrobium sp.]MBC7630830.1 NAD-dependent epimerase/dehydratase family protein [Aeromicrobium sp.]